jgi:hypothetical protein
MGSWWEVPMTMPYWAARMGLRVVVVEGVAPHGGPEVIGFEPQQEFEYMFVEEVVEVAEFFMDPAAERGRFVVDEEAAVFYGRRAGLEDLTAAEEQRVFVWYGDIAHQYQGETPICFDSSKMP